MKKIYRITAILLCLCIALLSCGCNSDTKKPAKKKPTTSSVASGENGDNVSSDNDTDDVVSSDDNDIGDIDIPDFDDSDFNLEVSTAVTFKKTAAQTNYAGIGGNVPVYLYFPDDTIGDGGFSEKEIELSIKRVVDSGVDIVRAYGVMPGQSTSADGKSWDWNSKYMQCFYRYAKAMQDNGIDIILNPNQGMGQSSYSDPGLSKMKEATGKTYQELFAEWCVEYVREVVIKRGFSNIKYLMYATEPNNGSRAYDLKYVDEWLSYVSAAHNALKTAGLRDRWQIVGPNIAVSSNSWDAAKIEESRAQAVKWIDYIIDNCNEAVDIYSVHDYYNSNLYGGFGQDAYKYYKDFCEYAKNAIKRTGKPFWWDEWNISSGRDESTLNDPLRAYEVAMGMLSQMTNGANHSVVWFLLDTKWPGSTKTAYGEYDEGVMKMGVIPSALQSATPYPAFYSFALVSSAVQPGDDVYSLTDDDGWIHAMLLKHKNGKYSIVAINASYDTSNVTFNIPWNLKGTFERAVYDPLTHTPTPDGKTIKPTSTVKITNTFTDKISAYQVVVYNQK